MIIELNEGNRQQILESDEILILFLHLISSGGPCNIMFAMLEKIVKKYEGRILIVKIDLMKMEFKDLILDYRIRAAPTTIIQKKGNIIQKFTGYTFVEKIEKVLDEILEK